MNRIGLFLSLWLVTLPLAAGPWQGFTALAISPDGRWFATGGREGELVWFEMETGEPRGRWSMTGGYPVVGLIFGGDSSYLGATDLNGSMVVVSPGKPPAKVSPGSEVTPLMASAVTRWLSDSPVVSGVRTVRGDLWAQGGTDGTITVGSVSLGRALVTWQAHDAAVTGLAFSADGGSLLSASYDGSLRRWDSQTGQPRGNL